MSSVFYQPKLKLSSIEKLRQTEWQKTVEQIVHPEPEKRLIFP